jgi:hypothetical protein
MPRCCFCEQERKLIRAHIIPEAFFRANRDESNELYILSSRSKDFARRARVGEYDEDLLCAECEQKFQDYDDYAARVLLEQFDALFERTTVGEGVDIFIGQEQVDQRKLLQFEHEIDGYAIRV